MSTIAVAVTINLHITLTLAVLSAKSGALSLLEKRSNFPVRTRRGAGSALGDIFTEGIVGASSGALATIFGGPPTCCDDGYGALAGCLVNAGKDSNGNRWMACYYPGKEQIFDFDVATMKCIINLHYVQDDACIDVAGSVCGNGYGGGLMLGHMGFLGGNIKADQISAQDSVSFQAAADSMLNVQIDYNYGPQAIDLVLPDSQDNILDIEIFFQGHKAKDC